MPMNNPQIQSMYKNIPLNNSMNSQNNMQNSQKLENSNSQNLSNSMQCNGNYPPPSS